MKSMKRFVVNTAKADLAVAGVLVLETPDKFHVASVVDNTEKSVCKADGWEALTQDEIFAMVR